MKRFLIIAYRRTGSNFLVSLLNSNPEITCYGEIFRNRFQAKRKLPQIDERFYAHSQRLLDPHQLFLQIEKRQEKRTSAWGFKLMPHQVGERLTAVLDYGFDFALVLKRSNKLAQYSSDLIALETGQGIAGKNAKIKTAKVKFFARGFQRFSEEVDYQYSNVERALQIHQIPSIQLEYVDLKKSSTHKVIQQTLGVPEMKLKSYQKKRNESTIINRFSNVDTVRKYLLDTGQNHLMIENELN